jgi:pyridoxine 4-dehydrogenase
LSKDAAAHCPICRRHLFPGRPHREPHGLWCHAARRTRGLRPAEGPRAAVTALREATLRGVNHIDTSDFYGPHVTNQIIREGLHPYAKDLTIVTKVGATRGEDASWNPAIAPADLVRAVHDNLRNLGIDALDVVNLRVMGRVHGPSEGSIAEPFAAPNSSARDSFDILA